MEKSREKQQKKDLQQQFNNLEQEWQSFKQSKKSKSKLHDHDYDFHSNSKILLQFTNDSSPRNLMSSLQNKPPASPPSTTPQGLEIEGRKLFDEDFEGEDEVGFDGNEEISNFCSSLIDLVNAGSDDEFENYCENYEVGLNDFEQEGKRGPFGCHQGYDDSCSNSSLTSEIGEREEMVAKEVTVAEKAEEKGSSEHLGGGYGRRLSSMMVMVFFVVILLALILGIIHRVRVFGVEDTAFLVPT